jgi:hypothetical protein
LSSSELAQLGGAVSCCFIEVDNDQAKTDEQLAHIPGRHASVGQLAGDLTQIHRADRGSPKVWRRLVGALLLLQDR